MSPRGPVSVHSHASMLGSSSIADDGWDLGLSLDKACQIIVGEVAEAAARVIIFESELKQQQDSPSTLFLTELQAALAAASAQVVLAEARVADLDARRKRTVARPETLSRSCQDLQAAHVQVNVLKTRVEHLQETVTALERVAFWSPSPRTSMHAPDAAAGAARPERNLPAVLTSPAVPLLVEGLTSPTGASSVAAAAAPVSPVSPGLQATSVMIPAPPQPSSPSQPAGSSLAVAPTAAAPKADSPEAAPAATSGRRMAVGGSSMPTTKVLLWNLQLAQLTGNPLEFLPSKGALSPAVHATMSHVLHRVDHLMLRPDTSPRLCDLLGHRPITQATAVEKTPIAKVPAGLQRWLESRQAEWAGSWPCADARQAAELWCRDYTARWSFWQRQTLHEWLCDDGSGGKANPWLPSRQPTVSEVCPDLSLAAADLAYGNPPARCSRAKWMRHARKAGVPFGGSGTKIPGPPRHDLFKLLVWDLIIDALLARLPDAQLGALFRELRTAHSEFRMKRVAALASTADVAILLGAPSGQGMGLEGSLSVRALEGKWAVRSQVADEENGIVIAARKDLFREPILESLPGDGGVPDPHVVACTLIRQDQGSRLTVIGVRTPSNKREARHLAERLEALLGPSTILGIDFGEDVRSSQVWWDVAASLPKLGALLDQARNLPRGLGTVNKQRSPFQPQLSKMFLHDLETRDLLFVGDRFEQPRPQGLLSRARCLPDAEVPSDHAPLMVHLRPRGGGQWEATGAKAEAPPPESVEAAEQEVPIASLVEGSRLPPEVQVNFMQHRPQPAAPVVAKAQAEERQRPAQEVAKAAQEMAKAAPPVARGPKAKNWSPPSLPAAWQHAAVHEEPRPVPRAGRGPPSPSSSSQQGEALPFTRLAVDGRTADAAPAGLSVSTISNCESPPLPGTRVLLGEAEEQTADPDRSLNLERRVDMLHGMFRNREAQLMEEQLTTARLRSELESVQGELRRRREEEERLREQVQSLEGRLSSMRQGGASTEAEPRLEEADQSLSRLDEQASTVQDASQQAIEAAAEALPQTVPDAVLDAELDDDAGNETQSVSDATVSVEGEADFEARDQEVAEVAEAADEAAEEYAEAWGTEGWEADGGEWTWQEGEEWDENAAWGDENGEWPAEEGAAWDEAAQGAAWDEAAQGAAWDEAAQGSEEADVAWAEAEQEQPERPVKKDSPKKAVSWGNVEMAMVPTVEAESKKVSFGEVETAELQSPEDAEVIEPKESTTSFRDTDVYRDLERSMSEHLRPEDREGMMYEEADDGLLEAVITPPEALLEDVAPESEDSFIQSCREIAKETRLVLVNATSFHLDAISSELGTAMNARRSGQSEPGHLRDSIRGSIVEDSTEMRRPGLLAEMVKHVQDLKTLAADLSRKDLPVHMHIPEEDRHALVAHLEVWTRLCENELRILRMPTALGDVPESFVSLLTDLGPLDTHCEPVEEEQWDGGMSPVHWAAQHSRRDLMEYFCRHAGTKSMLNSYDEKGRAPLYYAQGLRGTALVAWLRRESGFTAPIHKASDRPKELTTLPVRLRHMLDDIEVHGWRSAKWASNFTMLHWAATKGNKALLRYCMNLGADLNAQDTQMRTPLDCATQAGQKPTTTVLNELMRRPTDTDVCLSAFRCKKQQLTKKLQPRCTLATIDLSAFNAQMKEAEKIAVRGSLPETYLRIWQQSEEIGWEHMEWVNGYTLLHWAAKNNLTELCARLMCQKADPWQKDGDGKDAFDYAVESSSKSALERLRLGPPSSLPPVMMTPISKELRQSREVKVTPELQELQRQASMMEEQEASDSDDATSMASDLSGDESFEELNLLPAEAA